MPTPPTRTKDDLRRELGRIDGRGYPAYKDIAGSYDCGFFILHIDHVQGDPFAAPSRLRAEVRMDRAGFPPEVWTTATRRRAAADFLNRAFDRAIADVTCGRNAGQAGSGKSGLIAIDRPGQEVLERTSMIVDSRRVEARFVAGLPAAGRRILGREAIAMLCGNVPAIVRRALFYDRYDRADREALTRHIETVEDQDALRRMLPGLGLVAFVGDGAILPRVTGVSDQPLRGPKVVPFLAPPSLSLEVDLPNAGRIRGMGIPHGVTLIVGGGYHGKSTLLRAIERGIYSHVPGDGRELVVTDPTAVKIRAEDGRRVEGVDISPFINNLPGGTDTTRFATEDASGSTSQAANIIEALELGARVLLLDEDTSATNFMIRDTRMQALVAGAKEPITPFIDRVRSIYEDLGVSTILVVGGSGDYFDVADRVIMMDEYRPRDVTERANEIARQMPTGRRREEEGPLRLPRGRVPLPEALDARRRGRVKIKAWGVDEISFGEEEIDLHDVEQIVDPSQTRAVGAMLHYAVGRHIDGKRTLREALAALYREVEERGLDIISPYREPVGDFALPRLLEVGAAINRLRSLKMRE